MRTISKQETAQHLKNLQVYGYTHVRRYADARTVRRLKALVEKFYSVAPPPGSYRGGREMMAIDGKGVFNLQNKDKFFIDILDDPFLKAVLMAKLNDPYYRFLPPHLPNYILSYYNARSSGKKLDLHIDSLVPAIGDWTWGIQTGLVLENHTLKNGCTILVPGSHMSGRYTDRDLDKVEPILSKAGDLVLWDSRTWHGTLENTSGKSRWTLLGTFTTWWVKQTVDMTRSLPDEIYQKLNDAQKLLLGFCSIPPKDEFERINTKNGYDFLKPSVKDYY